ncbi:tetratricopeptide repeat protein [Candidatus Omnitrophota bacterium]
MFRKLFLVLIIFLVLPKGVFAVSQEDKNIILQEIGNFMDKDPSIINEAVRIILDDYEREGKVDEAVTFYRKALDVLPNNARLVIRFADSLSEWRRWDEAIEQYRRAQILETNNLWHSMRVADLLVAQERYDEAKNVLDNIVAQAQDDWNRSQAQERLANIADKVTIEEVVKSEPEPGPEIKRSAEKKIESMPEPEPKKKKKKRGWFFRR